MHACGEWEICRVKKLEGDMAEMQRKTTNQDMRDFAQQVCHLAFQPCCQLEHLLYFCLHTDDLSQQQGVVLIEAASHVGPVAVIYVPMPAQAR